MSSKLHTTILTLLAVIMSIYIGYDLYCENYSDKANEHQLIVEELEGLGRLELYKAHVRDVAEYTADNEYLADIPVANELFKSKILAVIGGEIVAYINLNEIHEKDIHLMDSTVIVDLPVLHIDGRVNPKEVKIYSSEHAGPDAMNQLYIEAEKKLKVTGQEMQLEARAKENAKQYLAPILSKISGNKNIKINFKDSVHLNYMHK
ncbi:MULTISPECIES: DUF4230 domain-containing protein [Flammeovirga]|uniref:DUF4230 domain-containing protein n=1 Tax=Flammeovirga agarivorans TaxID=2726742 RepID=A0A7X8SQG2_9BACT|nr:MULTISPECIES: DUF4230 domain-containing protein [Flammeovirga]NLR94513.1 DUF4230 domain-containing protein [Flammeovirga agarivorans]